MGFNPSSFAKRQREIQRQRKKAEKQRRRAEKKRMGGPDSPDGVDPDIAGIVPGPQPQPWMEDDLGDDSVLDKSVLPPSEDDDAAR